MSKFPLNRIDRKFVVELGIIFLSGILGIGLVIAGFYGALGELIGFHNRAKFDWNWEIFNAAEWAHTLRLFGWVALMSLGRIVGVVYDVLLKHEKKKGQKIEKGNSSSNNGVSVVPSPVTPASEDA